MQRKENTRSNGGFSRTLKLWLLPAVLMIFLAAGAMMSQKVYAVTISPDEYLASSLAGTDNYSASGAYDTITVIMDQDLSLCSLKVDRYDLRFIADPHGKGRKTLTFNAKNTALEAGTITIEGVNVNCNVTELSTSHSAAIQTDGSLTLKDASLSVKTPSGYGISVRNLVDVSGSKLNIEGGFVSLITDEVKFDNTEVQIKSSGTGIEALQGSFHNTSGMISGEYNGITSIDDMHFSDSDLTITGQAFAAASSHDDIYLSDTVYCKAPAGIKHGPLIIDETSYNSVILNADGTPAKEFVISRKRISDPICSVADIPEQTRTGSALQPELNVLWDKTALKKGTDYSAVYKNNINAGTATVTLTGMGKYCGTREVTFKILASTAQTGGMNFNLSGDAATVSGPVNKKSKTIVIPDIVAANGKSYKVTAIAPKAFAGMKKLTRVTIGKNIDTIGKKAFYKCKKLKKITIKSKKLTKKKTGAKAFTGIYKSAFVKCPKGKVKAYKKFLLKKGMRKTMKFK